MAYRLLREFRQASTRLDTPPFSNRRHPFSGIALPQTPDDTVRAEFGEGTDDPELLWSIGNLALVEKSINASLGRRPFSEKRPVYPKSQYLLTRAITELPEIGNTAIDRAVSSMTPFSKWDRAAVRARAVQLAVLAAKVWGVPDASAPGV